MSSRRSYNFRCTRDSHGVPHITAGTWQDCLYGLGSMHASDRPTQMLFARAVGQGRAAERIADKAELLEMDRLFRRAGLSLHLDREVGLLSTSTRTDLAAYCQGINDGLGKSGRSLPMWAAGFQPELWDEKSILLIGNLLNYSGLVVQQQRNERLVIELIQAGVAPELLADLFTPHLDGVDFDLMRKVKIANRLSDETLELISDLPLVAGSNAWAVAPSRSAGGSAMLASDPHLEVNRLPSIWYEAVLRWGDEFVMGASLPGCPLFAVARNRHVAWGVTYSKGDSSDFFIEDCRLSAGKWQYRRGDRWFDFDIRREEIGRKGAEPVETSVYYNSLGMLEGDPDEAGPGYYLLGAWTGSWPGVGRTLACWLDLVTSESAEQLLDVARRCPQPTLCWVAADGEGHIGMQVAGWYPQRTTGHSSLVPAVAWEEQNHWQGRIPDEQLPRIFDPAEGFVATANENINPPDGPSLVTHPLPDYRKRRIVQRLGELPQATLEDMQALQYDVVSLQARDLLQVFLPHLPDGDIKDRLARWDCRYTPQSVEATLFMRLYRNVLLEIFGLEPETERGIGWRRILYLCTRAGFSLMIVTCIDRLLARETSLWWKGRAKGELIRRGAARLTEADARPWSETNAFSFSNRFIQENFVGRALGFHSAEMAMPGCHATPFQGHLLRVARRETTFAPSYHLVADMGTQLAWTNLPGGPSESRFSRWYRNDISRWIDGRYKRLQADQNGGGDG